MATEIEHKYKVLNDSYLVGYTSAQYFRQGYLTVEKDCVVRVRIVGKKAFLTIKGKNRGCSRVEYELSALQSHFRSSGHYRQFSLTCRNLTR